MNVSDLVCLCSCKQRSSKSLCTSVLAPPTPQGGGECIFVDFLEKRDVMGQLGFCPPLGKSYNGASQKTEYRRTTTPADIENLLRLQTRISSLRTNCSLLTALANLSFHGTCSRFLLSSEVISILARSFVMTDAEAPLLTQSGDKSCSNKSLNARDTEYSSSYERTVTNLTKCFVGAASFELPWAFMQAGLLGSIVGVTVLATLSSFSLRRLALSGQLALAAEESRGGSNYAGVLTFPELGMIACGPWGKRAAWFGTIAMSLGTCGSYFVFISSTMHSVTSYSYDFWTFGVTLPVTIALSCLPSLKYLAPTSFLGVCALILSVLFVLIDGYSHNTAIGMILSLVSLPAVRVSTFPLFLGNVGFLFLISTAILPIAQNMKTPSKFGDAFNSSALIVTIMNIAFGFMALAVFGDCVEEGEMCTQPNIIDNLYPGTLSTCVKVALSIDLVFTAVIFIVPLDVALEREFGINPGESKSYLLRAAVPCAIAVVAKCIPFFSLLTGLSGGFGNNLLGFILPPIFYYRIREKDDYWSYRECGGQRPWNILLSKAKDNKVGTDDESVDKWQRNRSRLLEELGITGTLGFGIIFLVLTLVFFGREIMKANGL